MRIWVFLLALSFALASKSRSKESENVRRSSRLRSLIERTRAPEQTSKRRSDDRITERQLQYCGPNEVVGEFGRCERAVVTKNVYAFTAPKYRRPILPPRIPQPKLDLNVVFVKTAPNELPPAPLVVPPTQQKTVVYLLSKTPRLDQQLIEVPSPGPVEPEVFFVNYGSGENPSLPGGIDLRTALRQAPLEGQIVSTPQAVRNQQSAFANQGIQDFSFEDDSQGNFLGQSTVQRGVLSQSQGQSSNLVTPPTNQFRNSVEVNQQTNTLNQFQPLQTTNLQSPSSSQFQSPPSNQFQPLPPNHLQSLPPNQFQSLSPNRFQSTSTGQFQPPSSNQFQSSNSNQFQPAVSNQFQAPIDDSFGFGTLDQQVPYANHLFDSSSKNQFNSPSGFVSNQNSDNSFETSELQISTRNEFKSKKRAPITQSTRFDGTNERSQNAPTNEYRTPSRAPSSSPSSIQSAPPKRFESPSNSLIEKPRPTVQMLQPAQFGLVDDVSNERASLKKKIKSLPSGFVPAIQSQPSQNTLSQRPRFKPSPSIPNREFESPGRESFTPVPGSQYSLPPRNFQYAAPPLDQSTASADQYRAPLVVQKLEPELWEDVPTVKASRN